MMLMKLMFEMKQLYPPRDSKNLSKNKHSNDTKTSEETLAVKKSYSLVEKALY